MLALLIVLAAGYLAVPCGPQPRELPARPGARPPRRGSVLVVCAGSVGLGTGAVRYPDRAPAVSGRGASAWLARMSAL
jgi:hypothetical protein